MIDKYSLAKAKQESGKMYIFKSFFTFILNLVSLAWFIAFVIHGFGNFSLKQLTPSRIKTLQLP